MPTKYFLHGGMPHRENGENDVFMAELLANTPINLTVLLVYFAETEDRIEHCLAQDIEQYERNKGYKNITFEIAQEESFTAQIKKTDIIYIRGGITIKLLAILKKFPDLHKLFEGKIVVAESAGVYVLSTFFYSKTMGGVFAGLGILPIKSICHYVGENKDKLSKCPDELEYVLLPSFAYRVFVT